MELTIRVKRLENTWNRLDKLRLGLPCIFVRGVTPPPDEVPMFPSPAPPREGIGRASDDAFDVEQLFAAGSVGLWSFSKATDGGQRALALTSWASSPSESDSVRRGEGGREDSGDVEQEPVIIACAWSRSRDTGAV